jgi:hypothetical protein
LILIIAEHRALQGLQRCKVEANKPILKSHLLGINTNQLWVCDIPYLWYLIEIIGNATLQQISKDQNVYDS